MAGTSPSALRFSRAASSSSSTRAIVAPPPARAATAAAAILDVYCCWSSSRRPRSRGLSAVERAHRGRDVAVARCGARRERIGQEPDLLGGELHVGRSRVLLHVPHPPGARDG